MVGSFRVTLGHPREVGINEVSFVVFPDYKTETARKKGFKAVEDLKSNDRIVVSRSNFGKGTASITLNLKNLNIWLDYIQTGANNKPEQEAKKHIIEYGKNKVDEFKDSQEYKALVDLLSASRGGDCVCEGPTKLKRYMRKRGVNNPVAKNSKTQECIQTFLDSKFPWKPEILGLYKCSDGNYIVTTNSRMCLNYGEHDSQCVFYEICGKGIRQRCFCTNKQSGRFNVRCADYVSEYYYPAVPTHKDSFLWKLFKKDVFLDYPDDEYTKAKIRESIRLDELEKQKEKARLDLITKKLESKKNGAPVEMTFQELNLIDNPKRVKPSMREKINQTKESEQMLFSNMTTLEQLKLGTMFFLSTRLRALGEEQTHNNPKKAREEHHILNTYLRMVQTGQLSDEKPVDFRCPIFSLDGKSKPVPSDLKKQTTSAKVSTKEMKPKETLTKHTLSPVTVQKVTVQKVTVQTAVHTPSPKKVGKTFAFVDLNGNLRTVRALSYQDLLTKLSERYGYRTVKTIDYNHKTFGLVRIMDECGFIDVPDESRLNVGLE
jgi:hypothetical protein